MVTTVADDEVDDIWGLAGDICHNLPLSAVPWRCHIFCHLYMFTQVTSTITPGGNTRTFAWE